MSLFIASYRLFYRRGKIRINSADSWYRYPVCLGR